MNIMFFAHDPGGANAILPLIDKLKNHPVSVFARNAALKILPNSIEYEDNLEKIMPGLIITGTSANDFTEKHMWQKARSLNIKSIAIVDHWCNYGIRFSKYGLIDLAKFNKKCDYLPDYIIVMDEFAKRKMIEDGVPENIILPLGNPHFEKILNDAENLKINRSLFANENQKIITFASEPITEDFGQGEELTAISDLINICENKDVKIIIKPHPREEESKFYKFESTKVEISKNLSSTELISISDIVISVTSMFLIESLIMKKKIISYQPNEKDKNAFILTEKDAIPFINNKNYFKKEIDRLLNDEKIQEYSDTINYNASKDIINFIESKIWVN